MSTTYRSESAYNAYTTRPRSVAKAARARRLTPVELLVLAVLAALLIASPFLTRQHAGFSGNVRSIQVQAGDSLWSIAQTHPIPGLSTAQAVEVIASRNAISDGAVSPGQTIVVPAQDNEGRLAMR